MRLPITCLGLLTLCLAAVPAVAQNDLYDNGATDGQDQAVPISFGFEFSDTFTLNSNSTLNGVNFAAWLFPGDVLETAEVSITSSEFGGTTYFDQTVSFAASGCFLNNFGFNVCNETGGFSGVGLNAGTYWLNLQNGVVSSGDPVYWDLNGGPSEASNNSVGSLPSESFTILGHSTGTGTTPEPASLVLFISGVAGVVGFIRRNSKV